MDAEQTASGKRSAFIPGCLSLVLILGVVGWIAGKSEGDGGGSAVQTGPRVAQIQATPGEILSAYKENEAAAQMKYGKQVVGITAVIDAIDLGLGDKPYLLLRTGNEFERMHGKLAESHQPRAATLKKGQKIVLLCDNVHELAGTPMADNCTF